MSEKYMFFDSKDEDIREYSSENMAELLSGICPNGVLSGLVVSGAGEKAVTVSAGKAVINGYVYVLTEAAKFPVVVLGFARKDRIVIRLDMVNRVMSLEYLTGTSTTPPSLTQNDEIYEIPIVRISIQANSTAVQAIASEKSYSNDYHNLYNKPIYSGTDEPSGSLGKNGDIYIQYEE